jgi:hypothetical protein
MILPIGVWLLSVIFATYLGHGLMVQINEKRARVRWYVWVPEAKREYIMKADKPTEYWSSIGVQGMLFALCVGLARGSV